VHVSRVCITYCIFKMKDLLLLRLQQFLRSDLQNAVGPPPSRIPGVVGRRCKPTAAPLSLLSLVCPLRLLLAIFDAAPACARPLSPSPAATSSGLPPPAAARHRPRGAAGFPTPDSARPLSFAPVPARRHLPCGPAAAWRSEVRLGRRPPHRPPLARPPPRRRPPPSQNPRPRRPLSPRSSPRSHPAPETKPTEY
jgi:hypothetical protein